MFTPNRLLNQQDAQRFELGVVVNVAPTIRCSCARALRTPLLHRQRQRGGHQQDGNSDQKGESCSPVHLILYESLTSHRLHRDAVKSSTHRSVFARS
jgi:hypothetical protein